MAGKDAIRRAQAERSGRSSAGAAGQTPQGALARVYLLHLLQRDHEAARATVVEAMREGRSLCEICDLVLIPAIVEINRMWAERDASLGDEHYCTAATQMILAQLRALGRDLPAIGLHALVLTANECVPDSLACMTASLLESEGWSADSLSGHRGAGAALGWFADGATVRVDAIILVATPASVASIPALVAALRSAEAAASVPIVVRAWQDRRMDPQLPAGGADACTTDSHATLQAARALATSARAGR